MTQFDSTTAGAAYNYRGIRRELSHLIYQFCVGPWGYTGVVVERVEGKIIISFFLFIISFYFYSYAWFFITILLTNVLHVCSVCSLLIHARRLWSIRRGGPWLGSGSAICFMTFVRMTLAPIGSLMRSSSTEDLLALTRVLGKAGEGLNEQRINLRWLAIH